MVKLTLADGAEVEFAGINGSNFIVPDQKEMDTSIFTDENLKSVTVETDDGKEEFKNWTFVQQQKQANGDYYICFTEIPAQDIANAEVKDLVIQIAEIEIASGNLALEDISGDI
ncbi:MAG: hypothetical protein LUD72_09385, partial [Bacteroidales bacterium]|nr:hypothetical protein [Bacteroidales bacterium]